MSREEKQRLVKNNSGNERPEEENTSSQAADQTAFEDVPVYTTCPACLEKIVTRTSFKSGKYTYWTSACLCIFQCYCCMWIPFILDGLKNVIHTCPKCGANLGEYSRLRADRILKRQKKQRQDEHMYGHQGS